MRTLAIGRFLDEALGGLYGLIAEGSKAIWPFGRSIAAGTKRRRKDRNGVKSAY